jgi:hypothetical protein
MSKVEERTAADEAKIVKEMEQGAEPLSPTEKKLIGYSLLIGFVLLILLVLVTGAYKF